MEQIVQVRQVFDDGTAQVALIRQSACSGDCHKCSGCGAAEQQLLVTARNPIGAKLGEKVRLRSESAPVLKAAVVLYILPLVLFFAGYALGCLWQLGWLVGLAGFLLGLGCVIGYDRLVVRKQKSVYIIFGYADPSVAVRKGDNEVD
jgi:sigma-E factor negative regulatory protein RseC